MSLNNSLYTAVSALAAQSAALSIVSNNLANSDTTGYKATDATFQQLVTGTSGVKSYSSGGVLAYNTQYVDQQGLIQASVQSTDLAIDGNGFFVVSSADNSNLVYYTRNGDFEIDENGNLASNGYLLMGWPLDSSGAVAVANQNNTSSLQPVDVYRFSSSAAATTEMSIEANLPANAANSDSFTTSVEVYDSLGSSHDMEITWTKTGTGTWEASFADPTGSDGSVSGTASGGPLTITFNSDGTLGSVIPDPPTITITGWTTGAADSTIALDLGTAGSGDGLSQYAQEDEENLYVDLGDIEQDGVTYGQMTGVTVDSQGFVIAKYDNGQTMEIYQLPLATFANPNGLAAKTGSVYEVTPQSGSYVLHAAGTGGAGDISGGSLESSTTDTAGELSKMIVAQQAYSAASQIVSTNQDMFDSLISAVR